MTIAPFFLETANRLAQLDDEPPGNLSPSSRRDDDRNLAGSDPAIERCLTDPENSARSRARESGGKLGFELTPDRGDIGAGRRHALGSAQAEDVIDEPQGCSDSSHA